MADPGRVAVILGLVPVIGFSGKRKSRIVDAGH
jgi:hypothetical protein